MRLLVVLLCVVVVFAIGDVDLWLMLSPLLTLLRALQFTRFACVCVTLSANRRSTGCVLVVCALPRAHQRLALFAAQCATRRASRCFVDQPMMPNTNSSASKPSQCKCTRVWTFGWAHFLVAAFLLSCFMCLLFLLSTIVHRWKVAKFL